LIEKNSEENDFVRLADFRMYKTYTAFDTNENYRVIKSYQHRRKKNDSEEFN